MQGDNNKKLNIPFIKKEIKNLYEEAFNEFIKKMKDLEKKNVGIEDIILDDDHNDDGSNTLRVYLQFENKYYNVSSDWNDLYRKHQLLGDGAEIGYDKEEKTFPFVKKIMDEPVQTSEETQFNQKELVDLLDMLVSLQLFIKNSGNPIDGSVKDMYIKILDLLKKEL